jgi:hypothetical protein
MHYFGWKGKAAIADVIVPLGADVIGVQVGRCRRFNHVMICLALHYS